MMRRLRQGLACRARGGRFRKWQSLLRIDNPRCGPRNQGAEQGRHDERSIHASTPAAWTTLLRAVSGLRRKCDSAGIRTMAPTMSQMNMKRSEEHTSELQSLMRISYAVFCLKKKNNIKTTTDATQNTPIKYK